MTRRKWIIIGMMMLLVLGIILPKNIVRADDEMMILEHYTSATDNTITYYIKGVNSSVKEISVMYGDKEEQVDEISTVGENNRIYTLILVDNSLSVMNKYDGQVRSLLKTILNHRLDGETFIVAEIEEKEGELTYSASDFSNEYDHWDTVIDEMPVEDKNADIYMNLNKAIKVLNGIQDSSYKRLIIISDGIHKEEESVSASEKDIENALNSTNYPIYTIGVQKAQDATTDLQNLYFYSRKTGAESFSIMDGFDEKSVTTRLNSDTNYMKLVTSIVNQPCDGTQNKNARITIDGVSLNCLVSLPVVAAVVETEEVVEETIEETETVVEVETEEVETVEEKPSQFTPLTIVLLVVSIVAVISIIILVIVLIKKGKPVEDPKKAYMNLDNQIKNERYVPEPEKKGMKAGSTPLLQKEPVLAKPTQKTQTRVLNAAGGNVEQQASGTLNTGYATGRMPGRDYSGEMVAPVNKPAATIHRVVLRSVENPEEFYSGAFEDKVTIGRNPSKVQIVIPDGAVSGVHCEIGISGNRFYIKDLQSSNGSFVNGVKCVDPTEIRDACQIRLGRKEFQIKLE